MRLSATDHLCAAINQYRPQLKKAPLQAQQATVRARSVPNKARNGRAAPARHMNAKAVRTSSLVLKINAALPPYSLLRGAMTIKFKVTLQ